MNYLKPRLRRQVLSAVLEGCSIQSTSRLFGVHKRTISSLIVGSGQVCRGLLDEHLRDLRIRTIEGDEIWTYVRKKQARLSAIERDSLDIGDQFLFVGIDPDSKLVAAHVIGKRSADTTTDFIELLDRRIPRRFQFFTDGYQEYRLTLEGIGRKLDYAQVIKPLPGGGQEIIVWAGCPAISQIGTSRVERHNGTIRQQLRRFTRKSLGYSKLLANLRATVDVYVTWYNFVRPHSSLNGMTPAMALGIADTFWPVDRLLPACEGEGVTWRRRRSR